MVRLAPINPAPNKKPRHNWAGLVRFHRLAMTKPAKSLARRRSWRRLKKLQGQPPMPGLPRRPEKARGRWKPPHIPRSLSAIFLLVLHWVTGPAPPRFPPAADRDRRPDRRRASPRFPRSRRHRKQGMFWPECSWRQWADFSQGTTGSEIKRNEAAIDSITLTTERCS